MKKMFSNLSLGVAMGVVATMGITSSCGKENDGYIVEIEQEKEEIPEPPSDTPESPSDTPEPPSDILVGKFSISSEKSVYFSKGNLYWDGNSSTWKFEDKQYYFRHYYGAEKDTANLESGVTTPENTVGSFYYDDDASVAYAEKYTVELTDSPDKLFTEVPPGISVNGGEKGIWRCLSKEEWGYLINDRNDAPNRRGLGKVYGVAGLILLSDDMSIPSGFTSTTNEEGECDFDNNSPDDETWELWEKEGAVFFPATGSRSMSEIATNCSVQRVGEIGNYWSCTPNSNNSYLLSFQPPQSDPISINAVDTTMQGYSTAISIRLVCNVE